MSLSNLDLSKSENARSSTNSFVQEPTYRFTPNLTASPLCACGKSERATRAARTSFSPPSAMQLPQSCSKAHSLMMTIAARRIVDEQACNFERVHPCIRAWKTWVCYRVPCSAKDTVWKGGTERAPVALLYVAEQRRQERHRLLPPATVVAHVSGT